MDVDYSLYLVTDRSFLTDIPLEKAVEAAIKGGVTAVQLREKNISTRDFIDIASALKKITSYYNIPLFINDRVDIALAIDADGIHLGQSDMPLLTARKILGEHKLIGISAENLTEAREAEENGADYVGIGTVFYTSTKSDINMPIGINGLKEICSNVSIPKIAIGGINRSNISDVISCGADGAAVISAILGEENIEEASRRLMNILKDSCHKF